MDLLCDTTARVTPTTNQCVGSSDDILVKETSTPHLTRHKGTTKDTDKEADEVEARGIGGSTSKGSGDSTSKQQHCKGLARANVIAHGPSNEANQRCGVRVNVDERCRLYPSTVKVDKLNVFLGDY